MLFRVDPQSAVPLAEQIAARVRRGIADAEVAAGERLPSARALAQSLGVNLHTVLRGYQQLRDEGLIELRRGRGAVVLAATPGRARLLEQVRSLAAEARALGLSQDELLVLVRAATGAEPLPQEAAARSFAAVWRGS